MYAVLDHTEQLAANIHTFWLKPERPMRFTAGQFIELYLPHDHADNRGQKRWFTLSSSPTEALLSITTKFAEQGSTFKQTLRSLAPGARVLLSDPMGDFVLPKDPATPLVFVAGGMGVTPVRSMTKWLFDNGLQRPAALVHAVNRPAELIFAPLFSEYYSNNYLPVVAEPDSNWQGRTGHTSAQQILTLGTSAPETSLFFLSGPELMIKSIEKDLRANGIARHRIVTDYFPGYQNER